MYNMKILKDNFTAGTQINKLPSRWLRFAARFFNSCKWQGFAVRLTHNGRGCQIGIEGHTGFLFGDRGSSYQYGGEEQMMLVFENGRCTEINQMQGPSGWQDGDSTSLGPYTMHGGDFVLYIHHFNAGKTGVGDGRLQFHDQDSVELYDSGWQTATIEDVEVDIPSGTTSITGTISGDNGGAAVDLATAYKTK